MINYSYELVKELQQLCGRRRLLEIWQDFIAMAAIAVANSVAPSAKREATYLKVAAKYSADDLQKFAKCMSHLTMALESEFDDVLGSAYMRLELSDKNKGQFFTPFALCRLMAATTLHDAKALIEKKGWITINDPAVGGGATLIAAASFLRDAGVNYQECLYVVGQDVDPMVAQMAYLQLSLLGVPGAIVVGNTLAMETIDVWYTPLHFLGGWKNKLQAQATTENVDDQTEATQRWRWFVRQL